MYRYRYRDKRMIWDYKQRAILRRLWATDLPASKIANHIAGSSRSGVISKAHRMGLQRRLSPIKTGRARTHKRASYRESERLALLGTSGEMVKRERADVGRAKNCQWPHGHPGTKGFGFCGKPTLVGSYCGPHYERAYQHDRL